MDYSNKKLTFPNIFQLSDQFYPSKSNNMPYQSIDGQQNIQKQIVSSVKRSRRSPVWQYFQYFEDGAICKICKSKSQKAKISIKSGCTSGMLNHLRHRHRNIQITPYVEVKQQKDWMLYLICYELISYQVIDKSQFFRQSFRKIQIQKPPKCIDYVINATEGYVQKIKKQITDRIQLNERFNLSIGVMKCKKSLYYLSMYINGKSFKAIGLGLYRLPKEINQLILLKIIRQKLNRFGINFESHICSITSNMTELNLLLANCSQKLFQGCIASGIYKAVFQAIYKNNFQNGIFEDQKLNITYLFYPESSKNKSSQQEQFQDYQSDFEDQEQLPKYSQYMLQYAPALQKLRQLIKFMQQPSRYMYLKNEAIKIGKILQRINIDRPNQWSSIYIMLKKYKKIMPEIKSLMSKFVKQTITLNQMQQQKLLQLYVILETVFQLVLNQTKEYDNLILSLDYIQICRDTLIKINSKLAKQIMLNIQKQKQYRFNTQVFDFLSYLGRSATQKVFARQQQKLIFIRIMKKIMQSNKIKNKAFLKKQQLDLEQQENSVNVEINIWQNTQGKQKNKINQQFYTQSALDLLNQLQNYQIKSQGLTKIENCLTGIRPSAFNTLKSFNHLKGILNGDSHISNQIIFSISLIYQKFQRF